MRQNFATALAYVLKHEGGFVNHPIDPGGMTNLGCSKKVWEEWVGRSVTEQEMRNLKPADVAPLYRAKYWDAVRADDLPCGVDYVVFDAAINSGPGRAIRWLQTAVGAAADGVIGPATLRAVRSLPASQVIARYSDARRSFLESLQTWPTFGKGWGRRVSEVSSVAKAMSEATSNLA